MLIDEKYMRRALQLARLGAGHTSPNPMVGAVIVAPDGTIIGEGWHRKCGEGHAEVNAVAMVADAGLLKDSTIYVTLEPCSHYGKTPPCARLIIERGIPCVVVGCLDPFPKVAGRGVAMLREAGIEVEVGLLEQECRTLNERFMTAHTTERPWVQLKWAQTADGYIALPPQAGENPLHMSTPVTMRLMHRQRALCDAIVIGANTASIDNPALTTRYWPGRSPLRVVLSRELSIPDNLKLLNDGLPTIIYNGMRSGIEGAVEYVKMDTANPQSWLEDLYRRGVTSVMVEGGTQVLQQMIDAQAWDEARVEVSSRRVGQGVAAPAIEGRITARYLIDGNGITYYKPM
ncbi:MAG: bifunctional diaminohydroxyphosphoribosylaminopyrimidine deaminase/5-amino-6-(5-phosphoribosylamino)uracil reductase RibD [Muribaculaceae bacterium]|nr:bifunctional diaminohydroxyphosphoribosylaminopyrimidine deaminase/5-amino-6-(5-phosphoribosylamino)uracil reductase RibD [Muribaculaceae bacterium]